MGLFYLLLSICNPGDNILVPEPGYPFYHNLAPAMQVEARIYNLLAEK
jgi:tyrosine aminotransferase